MANPDSAMRSVRTSSRTRVLYGIGIAIVGGEASQPIVWSQIIMSNAIPRLFHKRVRHAFPIRLRLGR